MSVKFGSARGQSLGTSAIGDHATGKEVSTQNYYVHSKKWYVYRAKDPNIRKYIAECMQKACDSNNVGYSQPQRLYLINDSKQYGYDPSKVTKNTSCDCSSLVRVCIYYALTKCGYDLSKYAPANFTTDTEDAKLMATGLFEKLTDDKHCTKSDYLAKGDILNTRVKGHTGVIMNDGSKCDASSATPTPTPTTPTTPTVTPTISTSTNTFTVTGDSVNVRYGSGTNYAVYRTTHIGDKVNKVDTTGWSPVVIDKRIYWISNKYIKDNGSTYTVTGDSVNVRCGSGTSYGVYKTVKKNNTLTKASTSGWTPIDMDGKVLWISSKYVK